MGFASRKSDRTFFLRLAMKKILATAFLSFVLLTGCFSSKPQSITVSSVYSFEGRYDSTHELVIDKEKAKFKDEDSVWVLSNHTLYYLLTSVSDSPSKIVFGKKAYSFDKKSGQMKEFRAPSGDSFDDEEYVWENWRIPDSGGK